MSHRFAKCQVRSPNKDPVFWTSPGQKWVNRHCQSFVFRSPSERGQPGEKPARPEERPIQQAMVNAHKDSAVQSAPAPLRNWASKLSKTNLPLNQQGQNGTMPILGCRSRPRMTETCKVMTWVKVSVNRTRVGRRHPRRRSCRPSSADVGGRSGSSRSAAWTAGSAGRSCPPSIPWSDTSSASTPRSTSPPSSSTSRTPRAKTRSSRTPRRKETTAVQQNTQKPTKQTAVRRRKLRTLGSLHWIPARCRIRSARK